MAQAVGPCAAGDRVRGVSDAAGDGRDAARAIDALRRGWPVRIEGADGGLAVLAVETADDARLAAFDPEAGADLLIAGERAAVLKLANQRDAAAAAGPVRVARVPWLDLSAAVALADPALDLATPLKGPYQTLPVTADAASAAALKLARLAGAAAGVVRARGWRGGGGGRCGGGDGA